MHCISLSIANPCPLIDIAQQITVANERCRSNMSYRIKNASREFGNEYSTPHFHSLFYGKIIINPDRTIKFWNFVTAIEVRDLAESRYLNHLRDHDIRIITGGRLTTCNCDRFWEDINLTIPRPQNTWIIAATLENQYRSESDFNNWTVTEVNVPEPNSLTLATIGLLGVLMLRNRKYKL